jgi:uncharacterized protein (TIGR02452 family)
MACRIVNHRPLLNHIVNQERSMKRTARAELARQTVQIVEAGRYPGPSGGTVNIADDVRRCLAGTQFFPPERLEALKQDVLRQPAPGLANACEVVNETTLAGISRLLASGAGPVAALNFASAKNPGGGFLGGSQAQEESLARSSALYASLISPGAGDYYERHRNDRSLLYSDAMILSPGCPVIRDDNGTLLDQPQLVTFITSAAPNAGAAADNRPEELDQIPAVFRRRCEYVLALAAAHGYRHLVLGAWGCGVFRNDPAVVAGAFAAHLRGAWAGRFERVVFSVFDSSPEREIFKAFVRAFSS